MLVAAVEVYASESHCACKVVVVVDDDALAVGLRYLLYPLCRVLAVGVGEAQV